MSTADKLVTSGNKAEIDCKAPRKKGILSNTKVTTSRGLLLLFFVSNLSVFQKSFKSVAF